MRAIRIDKTGGPEVLKFVDAAMPQPAAGEVLVRAHAIGVGKPDVLFRTGIYRWMPELPAIPGAEMSGRIEAIGAGVEGFEIGQPVLVYHLTGGCYAEYIAAPVTSVTALPANIDLDDAVSIPNYQVAWALLNEAAGGAAARGVYINGAAGGIGSAVIQIANAAGIDIIAGASSAAKCEFTRALGATHTVEYGREDVVARVLELTDGRGVDLILDHIIGPSFTDSLKMLAPMGMIVSFNALGGFPEKDLFREMRAELPRGPAVRCFTMHVYDHDPAGRERVMSNTLALFESGAVHPPVFERIALEDAARAHELLDARAVMGKLILKP